MAATGQHAVDGAAFLVRIDFSDWAVSGDPAPCRRHGLTVAIAGHVQSDGTPRSAREMAVHRYSVAGRDMTRDMHGQFCGCVADHGARRVLLFTDALGLRDLFWSRAGDVLWVSSDLDRLVGALGQSHLDEAYFAAMLGAEAQDWSRTPFEGVHRLAYGWTLDVCASGVARHRAWTPDPTPLDLDFDAACASLRDVLDDAVASVLPRAGKVMCEVSGGLDSSSVYATACATDADLEALSYLSDRGTVGQDATYARQVIDARPRPWSILSMDECDIIPETFGRFVAEPRGMLVFHQFEAIARTVSERGARVLLTGSAGDVIFEYGGITPAFLADPVYRNAPLATLRLMRGWARAKGGHRPWSHYLRSVAWPVARALKRGHSTLDPAPTTPPAWLSGALAARYGLDGFQAPPVVELGAEPGARHLWESVYEQAASENSPLYRALPVDVRHPLYHRPLVEFLLRLDFRTRRGWEGDRRLQRAALTDRLIEPVRLRQSKGSAQELHERHLMESARWYRLMTEAPRMVARGWVRDAPWRDAVERARIGFAGLNAALIAAINVELWLRALEETGLPRPGPLWPETEGTEPD